MGFWPVPNFQGWATWVHLKYFFTIIPDCLNSKEKNSLQLIYAKKWFYCVLLPRAPRKCACLKRWKAQQLCLRHKMRKARSDWSIMGLQTHRGLPIDLEVGQQSTAEKGLGREPAIDQISKIEGQFSSIKYISKFLCPSTFGRFGSFGANCPGFWDQHWVKSHKLQVCALLMQPREKYVSRWSHCH